MIDIESLNLEGTTRTFTFRTSQGPGELVMRLMSGDNTPFIDDILTRERAQVAEPPPVLAEGEPPAVVALEVTRRPGEVVANLAAQAADLHRWCFESLTIGGEACTREQGLQFLTKVALTAASKFVEISHALRVDAKQEASSDALAGESSSGSSTNSG